jgi:hypothetical protein
MKLSLHEWCAMSQRCRRHRADYWLSCQHWSLPPRCPAGFHQSAGAHLPAVGGEVVRVHGGQRNSSLVRPRTLSPLSGRGHRHPSAMGVVTMTWTWSPRGCIATISSTGAHASAVVLEPSHQHPHRPPLMTVGSPPLWMSYPSVRLRGTDTRPLVLRH